MSRRQHGSPVASVASEPAPAHSPNPKLCLSCGEAIPSKRLKAVPNATECVPCLEANGDVPKVRMYREASADGTVVESMFTKNVQLETQLDRVNRETAPDAAYEQALGDDSHLVRDNSQPIAQAYSMTEAFERDEEEYLNSLTEAQREKLRDDAKKRRADWLADRAEEVAPGVIQMPQAVISASIQ